MPLALDASTPAHVNSTGNLVTASFTAPAGALLVAFYAAETGSAANNAVTSLTDSGGLTWTRRAYKSIDPTSTGGAGVRGRVEVWTAVTTSATPRTITVVHNEARQALIAVKVFTDDLTPGIGAIAAAAGATGLPSVTLTTTASGSQVWATRSDNEVCTAGTVGSGQTKTNEANVTAKASMTVWQQTDPTPASGTAVTMNMTAPSGQIWDAIAVEITPQAARGVAGEVAAGLRVGHAAAGAARAGGSAVADLRVGATATGVRRVSGAVAASLRLGAAATGVGHASGAAGSELQVEATAGGVARASGTAGSQLRLGVTGTGVRRVSGAVDAELRIGATAAAGDQDVSGTVTVSLRLGATATGVRRVSGAASAELQLEADVTGVGLVSSAAGVEQRVGVTVAGAPRASGSVSAGLRIGLAVSGSRDGAADVAVGLALGASASGSVRASSARGVELRAALAVAASTQVAGSVSVELALGVGVTATRFSGGVVTWLQVGTAAGGTPQTGAARTIGLQLSHVALLPPPVEVVHLDLAGVLDLHPLEATLELGDSPIGELVGGLEPDTLTVG